MEILKNIITIIKAVAFISLIISGGIDAFKGEDITNYELLLGGWLSLSLLLQHYSEVHSNNKK